MSANLVLNSLLLAGATTALATVLGAIMSLFLAAAPRSLRILLLFLAAAVLALPPFLVVNAWLDLFGVQGPLHDWLPFDLFSLPGAIAVLSCLFWPLAALPCYAVLRQTSCELWEVDPLCRGGRFIRFLLLPQLRLILAQSAGLIFVLSLNQFSVPALLQVKVFPAEVWLRFNTTFDYRAALALCWPMVVFPLALMIWLMRRPVAWPHGLQSWRSGAFRRQLGTGWFLVSGMLAVSLIILSALLPLFQLAANDTTWSDFMPALQAGRSAVMQSFATAFMGALLAMIAGWLTAGWRWGWPAWLLFFLPGVFLGIAAIHFLNRPFTNWIYNTFLIMWLVLLLRYFAPAWCGLRWMRNGSDRDLDDTARLQGLRGWNRFRHLDWPQHGGAMAALGYLVYLLCLWDVETLILIVPPGGETLSLRIFNLLHYGHTAQVNALCVLLLLLALLPLVIAIAGRYLWKKLRSPLALVLPLLVAAGAGCTSQHTEDDTRAELDSRIFERVLVIGERGGGLGQFNKPRSVTVDREDNIYAVDMTGRVQKFSPEGEFILSWQMPELAKGKPKGMGIDQDGNVVVVEPHYCRINHFTTQGELVHQWGAEGREPGSFVLPRSVAVTDAGDIWISEYSLVERVQKFGPMGDPFRFSIGERGNGPGEMNRPEGIGLGGDGRLFVADSCNHRIQVFSADGGFLHAYGRAGNQPGEFSYPYDVRIDAQGRQYVCEFGNSRIQILDRDHRTIEILGGPGAGPGRFNNPWSIDMDSQGNLVVADSLNHRLQKFYRRRQ